MAGSSPRAAWIGASASGTRVAGSTGATTPQKPLFTLQQPSPVLGVAFSPDGRRLAAGLRRSLGAHLGPDHADEVLILRGHLDAVSSVAFSPDGWRLASGEHGPDRQDLGRDRGSKHDPVPRSSGSTVASVRSVAFSPDGRWLASAGR